MYFKLTGAYPSKEQITQQATTVRAILVVQMDPPPAPMINVTPPNGHKKNDDGK